MIGTYYRLSLADEDVGADKAESNSIQGQRGLVEGYIMPTECRKMKEWSRFKGCVPRKIKFSSL